VNHLPGLLRDIKDSELELIHSWRNSSEVKKYMYNRHDITLKEHMTWWENIKQRRDVKQLVFEYDSSPVAVVGFSQIDELNYNAVWAFYLKPDAPRGLGSLLELHAIKYAFSNFNLHKLKCEVISMNSSVIKLHMKFGFCEEGCFRDEHFYDDDFVDVYRLGLLKSEWEEKQPEIENRIKKVWSKK
jgi:UDP-4-amino-4,6-dideoxy-N-acetyl-beta-L-altrosamine N-acetyltransferase